MDLSSLVVSLLSALGGGCLTLLGVWLKFRESMDGNFTLRKAAEVTEFTAVNAAHNQLVSLLTTQVASLIERSDKNEKRLDAAEQSEQECLEDRKKLQLRVMSLEGCLHGRKIVVLIEDSPFDQQLVSGLLADVMRDNRLSLNLVTELPEPGGWIESACCVVADVNLGETGKEEMQRFVEAVGDRIEVIIYSGNRYQPDEFGKATVLCKLDSASLFIEAVERAAKRALRKIHSGAA